MNGKSDYRWYAMSATYRNELKVRETLKSYGIESYIAMTTVVTNCFGRKLVKTRPAISNLIFVHAREVEIQNAKASIPHLQYKLDYEGGTPTKMIVRDADMEAFIKITSGPEEVIYFSPDADDIKAGTRIRVTDGSLKGLEGTFVKFHGGRPPMVMVKLDRLVTAGVRIQRSQIEPII